MIRVAAEDFARDSAELLKRVERGEEIWIEKDGHLIARLTPAKSDQAAGSAVAEQDVEALARYVDPRFPAPEDDPVGTLRRLRQGVTLSGLSWKDLRDEGRR
ncbi:type II toxin-antitoxin system Phd/YefM family antitoxin [Mongoliimonas terrestris]|uniref:type II toxin-antitoxin system Phd/YefM family antitoxin n=1 Tax=Mongoliimonas terrestris TaxID=1709001 RepID=UPI0009497A95|nr:hypothetical protein [Mongoliimonas terrestris]